MRSSILIMTIFLLLTACKKELDIENITDSNYIKTHEIQVTNDDQLTLNGEVISGDVTEWGFVLNTIGLSPFVGSDEKISVNTSTAPNFHNGPFTGKLDATYPDVTYAIRTYGIIKGQVYYGKTVRYTTPARGSWKRMNNFPGPPRKFAVSFAVNGKGYMGCGYNSSGNLKDFWEYDPSTDKWTQLANYPGPIMNSGFSFVIGNKAYVGGGAIQTPPYNNGLAFSEFYEFDPVTKIWTRLADIPYAWPYIAPGIYGAFAFSVGGFGFMGGGSITWQQRNAYIFKYDPRANHWEEYSLLPKNFRNDVIFFYYGASFVVDDVAYVGTGFTESNFDGKNNTFYSWNYQTKEWKYIIELPGPKVAFGIGTTNSGVGYMGTGEQSNDLYQFKPSLTGSPWKQVSHNSDHYGCIGGISFTIGNKTYIGLGDAVLPNMHEANRIYEFTHTR